MAMIILASGIKRSGIAFRRNIKDASSLV